MARQSSLPHSLSPIGATREIAAAYCSFSVGKFMNLVERRLFPKPKKIDGMLRWDLEEVRTAFKALPNDGEAESVDDTSWDD